MAKKFGFYTPEAKVKKSFAREFETRPVHKKQGGTSILAKVGLVVALGTLFLALISKKEKEE